MISGSIHPTIVKVEQCAYGHRIVDCFIAPAGRSQLLNVRFHYARWFEVEFVDVSEQRLFGMAGGRRSKIVEHGPNQRRIAEQFRRTGGVCFRSEDEIVPLGGERGDQFAQAGG